MGDLNKIGIGLTVVFVLSLVALFAEVCYIFFRRRRQQNGESSDNETSSRRSSSTKELLYLFCCGKGSSIELGTATTTIHPIDDDNVVGEQLDVLAKWQQMYGPSRILFTIKEEEKEDLESEKSCSERKSKCASGFLDDEDRNNEEEEKVVIMAMGIDTEGTETPYYTPSASPIHELQRDAGNMRNSDGEGEYFVVEVEKLSSAVKRGGSGS